MGWERLLWLQWEIILPHSEKWWVKALRTLKDLLKFHQDSVLWVLHPYSLSHSGPNFQVLPSMLPLPWLLPALQPHMAPESITG